MGEELLQCAQLGVTCIGVLFIYAGAAKLASRSSFRNDLLRIRLFHAAVANHLSLAIPLAEICAGTLTVLGLALGRAALLAMLCAFSIAAAVAAMSGRTVSCNCFGVQSEDQLSWRTVLRNLLLAAGLWGASQMAPVAANGIDIVYASIALLAFRILVVSVRNERLLNEYRRGAL